MLFLRRRPEEMGLLPDGDRRIKVEGLVAGSPAVHPLGRQPEGTAAQSLAPGPQSSDEARWTLGEAWRTRGFLFLLLAASASAFVAPGLNLHMLPYFMDVGLPLPAAVG